VRNKSTARDFGATGDGRTDDTNAIQKALDAAAARGGPVCLPPGRYALHGSLRIPAAVTLEGTWRVPHHSEMNQGTCLLAYGGRGNETGEPLIDLGPSSGVRGVTIAYPEQKLADVTPYPYAVRQCSGDHATVENVTLVNAWQGICTGPDANELHLIRNVYGCVLRRGIFIDNVWDIGRIENVHFNPHYWSRSAIFDHPDFARDNPDMAVASVMQEALEGFVFGKTDWQYVLNTFVYAARVGYRFVETAHGTCNGQLLGIGADACVYGLLADAVQFPGILVTNGEFVSFPLREVGGEGCIGVRTGPRFDTSLQLTNCSFWGGGFTHYAKIEGSGMFALSQARVDGCLDAGFEILGGRVSLRDVMFHRSALPHVRVGAGATQVVLTSNFAEGGFKVENAAGDRLVLRDNEEG